MNAKVFISSSFDGRDGLGVSRAERGYDGEWQTQVVAERYNVQCLARDPQDSNQVYAGTQERGFCARPTPEPAGRYSAWKD